LTDVSALIKFKNTEPPGGNMNPPGGSVHSPVELPPLSKKWNNIIAFWVKLCSISGVVSIIRKG